MFSWLFPPQCPCNLPAKEWIEARLEWLTDQFDDHIFNGKPMVAPTQEWFPDAYDGSPQAVRVLVDRVCEYMDVCPETVNLAFKNEVGKLWLVNEKGQYLGTAAGTYLETSKGYRITLDESDLGEPMNLVGTIAHELAHVHLLGGRRLSGSEFDNELLTDLTALFLGFGIFLANAPRAWESRMKTWPGTKSKRPEYMSRPMYSYALAHLAWFRGEERPPWYAHLHLNARPDFDQAVRFLFTTQNSAFPPPKLRAK